MDLQELHDKLVSEGCKNFYIEGVGGGFPDDIHILGTNNGKWEIYYTERGQRSKAVFSFDDKERAIEKYYDFIIGQAHWHLIVFTRSLSVLETYRAVLDKNYIPSFQSEIPDYVTRGDRVFRLFVVNKDIFRAKKVFEDIPYYDEDLKRN